jgi:hypothetical protein
LLVHADHQQTSTTGRDRGAYRHFTQNIKHSGAPAGDKHNDGGGMYRIRQGKEVLAHELPLHGGKARTLALGCSVPSGIAQPLARRKRRDKDPEATGKERDRCQA